MRGRFDPLGALGRSGILIDQTFFFSTFIAKAIDWPSGDHVTLAGDSSTCVTCDTAPSASM